MDENPLGLDQETMRRLGYRTVDMLVDTLSVSHSTPPRLPNGDGATAQGIAPRSAAKLRRDPRQARHRRPAVRRPDRPPPLPRLYSRLRQLAGRFGRLYRQRLKHRKQLVAGLGWSEPAGAGRARLVQGLDRLPGRSGRRAGERRLGGQHDRARVRPRGSPGRDERAGGGLRLRPGPFLVGAGGPHLGLPARPGAGAADGRALPDASGRPPGGDGRRPARAGSRSSWRPVRAPPTPARSTRCPSWRRSAGSAGRGSTSTGRTAASRR